MKQSKEKKVSRLQVAFTAEDRWKLKAEAAMRQMELADYIKEATREYAANHPVRQGTPEYKGLKRKDEKAS